MFVAGPKRNTVAPLGAARTIHVMCAYRSSGAFLWLEIADYRHGAPPGLSGLERTYLC